MFHKEYWLQEWERNVPSKESIIHCYKCMAQSVILDEVTLFVGGKTRFTWIALTISDLLNRINELRAERRFSSKREGVGRITSWMY